MLALAFSPHRGLEVKGSKDLSIWKSANLSIWKVGVGFSKVNYSFFEMENNFKTKKNREKRGMSRRCVLTVQLLVSLIVVNECVCIVCVCMSARLTQ